MHWANMDIKVESNMSSLLCCNDFPHSCLWCPAVHSRKPKCSSDQLHQTPPAMQTTPVWYPKQHHPPFHQSCNTDTATMQSASSSSTGSLRHHWCSHPKWDVREDNNNIIYGYSSDGNSGPSKKLYWNRGKIIMEYIYTNLDYWSTYNCHVSRWCIIFIHS